MNFLNKKSAGRLVLLILLAVLFVVEDANAFFAKESYVCDAEGNKEIKTTLELKLAKKKYRKKKRELKKELQESTGLKVRLVFFPFLDPPMNLGIGKCVSAEEGRLAIEKAKQFNRGVDRVIMQEFMPHHWIKIGATDLAELTFIPITPEDLERLSDPSLSTESFQSVYRELSALRERKLPFGLGIRKIEVDESE
ncbi:MAG: hypothetical protein VST69_00365 [Nitrospirota bacterium]|nr:hypothetical protein [Nitrospirota bacterium]